LPVYTGRLFIECFGKSSILVDNSNENIIDGFFVAGKSDLFASQQLPVTSAISSKNHADFNMEP
jgi:hypothetical protein